jgi:hypothetical protein
MGASFPASTRVKGVAPVVDIAGNIPGFDCYHKKFQTAEGVELIKAEGSGSNDALEQWSAGVFGKTQSHGCIRLTNWEAVELAGMVRPGDVVRFEDQDSPIAPSAETAPVSDTQRPELSRWGR